MILECVQKAGAFTEADRVWTLRRWRSAWGVNSVAEMAGGAEMAGVARMAGRAGRARTAEMA